MRSSKQIFKPKCIRGKNSSDCATYTHTSHLQQSSISSLRLLVSFVQKVEHLETAIKYVLNKAQQDPDPASKQKQLEHLHRITPFVRYEFVSSEDDAPEQAPVDSDNDYADLPSEYNSVFRAENPNWRELATLSSEDLNSINQRKFHRLAEAARAKRSVLTAPMPYRRPALTAAFRSLIEQYDNTLPPHIALHRLRSSGQRTKESQGAPEAWAWVQEQQELARQGQGSLPDFQFALDLKLLKGTAETQLKERPVKLSSKQKKAEKRAAALMNHTSQSA
jgi:hypothetical protein